MPPPTRGFEFPTNAPIAPHTSATTIMVRPIIFPPRPSLFLSAGLRTASPSHRACPNLASWSKPIARCRKEIACWMPCPPTIHIRIRRYDFNSGYIRHNIQDCLPGLRMKRRNAVAVPRVHVSAGFNQPPPQHPRCPPLPLSKAGYENFPPPSRCKPLRASHPTNARSPPSGARQPPAPPIGDRRSSWGSPCCEGAYATAKPSGEGPPRLWAVVALCKADGRNRRTYAVSGNGDNDGHLLPA